MSEQSVREDKGLPGWVIALIVVCGACLCGVPAVGGAIAVLVPKIQMQHIRAGCATSLRTLGSLHIDHWTETGGPPTEGGVKYFLRLAEGTDVSIVCPDDGHGRQAQVVQIGDDPMTTASEPMLRSICSYAVRDFARYPLSDDYANEAIAADREEFHRGGINVLYSDGSVKFHDRAWLGIPDGAPIVVGPESDHEELKKLCVVAE